MKYSGRSFRCQETSTRVIGAIVTETRLAIDWIEDSLQGGLVAESDDGMVYRGAFSYRTRPEQYHAEFRLFKDQTGDVLLLGRWWQTDVAEGGQWLLHLSPTA